MAANWDALVLNDYEAVMPLTWKKKWQIKYLCQPAFAQQLGIFFSETIGKKDFKKFIDKAFEHFRFAEIALNYANFPATVNNEFKTTGRNNYIISLSADYPEIYKSYHANFTKSLRRIKKFNLQYIMPNKVEDILKLYKKLYSEKVVIADKEINGFKNICKILERENNLIVRSVYSAKNKLLAASILLKDNNRIYNIISCITPEGKKQEANYFLYDKIIEEFSNTKLVLDMEGSDKKGIADFYKKLNPINEPYPFIKYNMLPTVVKLFKK
jgi:hypothetical protein